jgi:hypothetical protein
MKTILLLVLVAISGSLSLRGGDSPAARDPLELLIRNSTFVIDADVIELPCCPIMDELGVYNYPLKLHCREAYLGDFPKEDTVVIIEYGQWPNEDKPLWYHKGQRCIFFLRRGGTGFPPIYSTDIWFSVQSYRPVLASEVQALIKLQ